MRAGGDLFCGELADFASLLPKLHGAAVDMCADSTQSVIVTGALEFDRGRDAVFSIKKVQPVAKHCDARLWIAG